MKRYVETIAIPGIRLISQSLDSIDDGKILFFFFLVPCGMNQLILKYWTKLLATALKSLRRRFCHGSIPPKEVAGVDFFLHVVQAGIIAVCDNAAAFFLELFQIVDDKGTEKGTAVFQGGLVDDDCGTFGFDSLHDALDGGLTEVVTVAFHS